MGDRPTLASVKREVEELRADVVKFKHSRDDEAGVIDRCVAALNFLPKTPSSNYSTSARPIDPQAVERVLDYLRTRYGLPDRSGEARRLAHELEQAQRRVGELESRLSYVQTAVQS